MAALKLFADVVADSAHVPETASSVKIPGPSADSIASSGHPAAFSLVVTMLEVLTRRVMTAFDGPGESLGFVDAWRPVSTESMVDSAV